MRDAFYRRLIAISASSAELADIDAMAIVNITTLLGRHNHIQKDDLRDIVAVLKNFSTRADLDLATAIRDGIQNFFYVYCPFILFSEHFFMLLYITCRVHS